MDNQPYINTHKTVTQIFTRKNSRKKRTMISYPFEDKTSGSEGTPDLYFQKQEKNNFLYIS